MALIAYVNNENYVKSAHLQSIGEDGYSDKKRSKAGLFIYLQAKKYFGEDCIISDPRVQDYIINCTAFQNAIVTAQSLKITGKRMYSSAINQNCLGQFCVIPWNQASDIHQGSTLIT